MISLCRYGVIIVFVLLLGGCGIFYYRSKSALMEKELLKTQMELETTKYNAQMVQNTLVEMQNAKIESEKMVAELNKIIDTWNKLNTYDEKINMLQVLGKRRNVLIPEEQ